MPTGKREQAIFVTSGRPTLSTEVLTEQAKFVVEMGLYLKQAEGNNQESEFYDAMFKLWFSRWPEIPLDKDNIDFAAHCVEVTKKACKHDLSWTRVTKTIVLKPWQEFIAKKQDIFDAAQKEPSKRTFDNAFKSEKGMLQRQQRSPCRALSAMEKAHMVDSASAKMNKAIAYAVAVHPINKILKLKSSNPEYILIEDSDNELPDPTPTPSPSKSVCSILDSDEVPDSEDELLALVPEDIDLPLRVSKKVRVD
ncbi:hypothetical protein BYT27DRAFT_7258740 [Phlegmacium glaucopus]|nr:hypothetical protein BYT27DRAFT_7258740 [Phlegmacium glaucopus]